MFGTIFWQPARRLSLSRHCPAAAEWEAALDDLPKLAVAAGGDGARAASSSARGSGTSTGGGGGAGGSSTGVLRRALLALPPFPLEELLQQEQEREQEGGQEGPHDGRAESAGGGSGNAEGVAGALLGSGGSAELWRAYQMLSFLSHVSMGRGGGRAAGREGRRVDKRNGVRSAMAVECGEGHAESLGHELGVGGMRDGT